MILYLLTLLNNGYVSSETNTDVHFEEFILEDVVTLLYMDEVK